MKKTIKFMLVAISLLGSIGGALAWKSTKGIFVYCADLINCGAQAGTPECPRVQSIFIVDEINPVSCCTTTIKNDAEGHTGICDIPSRPEFKQ